VLIAVMIGGTGLEPLIPCA